MNERVAALFRAGVAAAWGRGAWPVAPLVTHASAAALMAALVRDVLPPFAYALLVLSFAAGLAALPLLGEHAPLLRADPAQEWIEAQPVTPRELRFARALVVLAITASLSCASALPIALLAPSGTGVLVRVELFAACVAQGVTVAAALLALNALLAERAEGLLVLLQTTLFAAVLAGGIAGLQHVPELRGVTRPEGLAWLPPAWFASVAAEDASIAWRVAPLTAVAAALALLLALPLPAAARSRRSDWLGRALSPLRWLATRAWVRRDERGVFDLVFDALPLEREVVLRSYPLIGIPIAFLALGSRSVGDERDALLALLLFSPGVYLPVLLAHVPASRSADARWILESAPTDPAAVEGGARKAIAVRFLAPLYVVLCALAAALGGFSLALRLAPVGACASLVVLRLLWPRCVTALPLSRRPEELEVHFGWTNLLLTVGTGLVFAAVAAWRFVDGPAKALAACAALIVLEIALDRRAARTTTDATLAG